MMFGQLLLLWAALFTKLALIIAIILISFGATISILIYNAGKTLGNTTYVETGKRVFLTFFVAALLVTFAPHVIGGILKMFGKTPAYLNIPSEVPKDSLDPRTMLKNLVITWSSWIFFISVAISVIMYFYFSSKLVWGYITESLRGIEVAKFGLIQVLIGIFSISMSSILFSAILNLVGASAGWFNMLPDLLSGF